MEITLTKQILALSLHEIHFPKLVLRGPVSINCTVQSYEKTSNKQIFQEKRKATDDVTVENQTLIPLTYYRSSTYVHILSSK